MSDYSNQHRGDHSDYEEYFAGMDASMQQKIALTTAHFPARGRIADMGSGSGSGTFDLARLYRGLRLVGVDINPVTVDYSRVRYRAENLEFEVGDIADRVFESGSLDGILDSSVLHHVTSFNDFRVSEIDRTLLNQVDQLKTGGVLIIRDFVVPDRADSTVILELPVDDGASSGPIPKLSTAALFRVFARDFRSSLNRDSGVWHREIDCSDQNIARFETTLRSAAEFILRKDYRDHWNPELLEEYTYFSQPDFENAFRRENLRIVVSMPLWNPWIVANRFDGRFRLSTPDGRKVTYPPTNYLIVGEKVTAGSGVQLRELGEATGKPSFLSIKFYRNRSTGAVYELAERPHRTLDILPWFRSESGQLFVLAKKDFPRPLLNSESGAPNLNRANFSGYITEPIAAIHDFDENCPDPTDVIADVLWSRAGIGHGEITGISEPGFYFTSPGGIDECVESHLVEIDRNEFEPQTFENYTRFASAGSVRELDALQVLRAAHVGGMFDARLEINIYRLLRRLGRSPGSWIGAAIAPFVQHATVDVLADLSPGKDAAFEQISPRTPAFLDHRRRVFGEFSSDGAQLSQAEFEYVVPRSYSKSTVAAIPFIATSDGVIVGIETRDLPAPQRFTGNSRIACVPAWRLPLEIGDKFDLEPFVRTRFPIDFGANPRCVCELGGAYFTSAGVTPETVFPLAVELEADHLKDCGFSFHRLRDLIRGEAQVRDAHLLVTMNRLAHALGVARS